MCYTAVSATRDRPFSTSVPPFIRQFPTGYPQAFAQVGFVRILSKSADSPVVLHTFFMDIISSVATLIFISFFVLFPPGKRAKSKRNEPSVEKRVFGTRVPRIVVTGRGAHTMWHVEHFADGVDGG